MQSQSAGFPLRKMENPAILGSDTEGKQGTYNGKKNRRRGALPPGGQQPAPAHAGALQPGGTGCPAIEQAIERLYHGQNEESFWALMGP